MKRIFHILGLSLCVSSGSVQMFAASPCPSDDLRDQRCFVVNGVAYETCSTEKVNHESCAVVFNRRYPVTLPTIQMKPGKRILVLVDNPLDFETLSLDWTSTTALPGTEQLASLATAVVPQLKGFATSNVTLPAQAAPPTPIQPLVESDEQRKVREAELARTTAIGNEFAVMRSLLATAQTALPDNESDLYKRMRAIYAQLGQVMAPIPKPGSGGQERYKPPVDAQQTPDPWNDYQDWRRALVCELAGGTVDQVACQSGTGATDPAFTNVLGDIAAEQGQLPSTPPAPPPANPLFDQSTFDGIARHIQTEIAALSPEDQNWAKASLKDLQSFENALLSRIAVLSAALTNAQKDFVTYCQNILMATHGLPMREIDSDHNPNAYSFVGAIYDPQSGRPTDAPVLYAKFLGRSATFTLNAVNNVATAETSVAAAASKVPFATVTALYADPMLESSAGGVFSFVHNRTFANQTITNPPTGSPYAPGDIVIAQTKTDPEVVPFVGLHWRVGNEYLMPDHRRGAAYGTVWVGLNPYSMVPEYGAGPTFSWRSLMFSFLYNRAHQTSLISGETQGEIVCSPTASAGGSPPPCAPAPPAPITKTTALNGFAIGLSVRIPTTFAAAPGGVSR